MQRTLTTSFRQDNNRPSMLPDKPVLSDGPSLPDWYVMMDRARLPDPSALVPHLPANSALIIRDPDPLVAAQMAVKLGEHCRRHGVLVLLSCPEPPQTLPCDGIHIPEKALARWRASDLQRLRPGLLTASAHSPRAIRRAAHFGCDAVIVSPLFATKSHPGSPALGFSRFARIVRESALPVIALGGIGKRDLRRIMLSGAQGVAGISLFSAPPV
jgi:thiamine-phosphate pyrophosphorylase